MDKSSSMGIAVALGGILGGMMIEGGRVGQVLQPTAALIVFGGTLGAVMLQFPLDVVLRSFREAKTVFLHRETNVQELIDQIVGFAHKARREGVVSLDKELDKIGEPFLRKAVMLAVDGTQPEELRETMEFELGFQTEQAERVIQVFEAGGGFAPTIGIIGAVLGLIQVMKHLENIEEVGKGIAVAFVATVYGVAVSNLVFLPAANKLKARIRQDAQDKELLLEGVCSIVEGMNPKLIRVKLEAFLQHAGKSKKKGAAEASGAAAPAAAKG